MKDEIRNLELSANWGTICTLLEMMLEDGKTKKTKP